MIDHLIIDDKNSFRDYGASVSARTIKSPTKKSIKETVPFSNVTYDFSAINGEVYWEENQIEYELELLEESPEDLEDAKMALSSWLMNVSNANIYDPFIRDFHFVGSFEELEYEDDEGQEKTTAKVVFAVYPYKIANEPDIYERTIAAGGTIEFHIENGSSHRLTPTITVEGSAAITLGNATFSVADGTYNDEAIKLAMGDNLVKVENKGSGECSLRISFYREVF